MCPKTCTESKTIILSRLTTICVFVWKSETSIQAFSLLYACHTISYPKISLGNWFVGLAYVEHYLYLPK